MSAATWGLLIATFVACFVEVVEATTIVMAMGFTRSWRSAFAGMGAALVALAVVTAVAGYALTPGCRSRRCSWPSAACC